MLRFCDQKIDFQQPARGASILSGGQACWKTRRLTTVTATSGSISLAGLTMFRAPGSSPLSLDSASCSRSAPFPGPSARGSRKLLRHPARMTPRRSPSRSACRRSALASEGEADMRFAITLGAVLLSILLGAGAPAASDDDDVDDL